MEHDSSRTGYHEPQPVDGGRTEEYWADSTEESGSPHYSINLIWAQARSLDGRSGAIGNAGGMPWHLREDLRRFADLTVSHPVIMGRKTWESLGNKYRPLPNRDNIVISHDPQYGAAGATVVDSWKAALGIASEEAIPDDGIDRTEIWVIGGGAVFRECLPFAASAYVTQIDAEVEADTFAPNIEALVSSGEWRQAETGEWRIPSSDTDTVKRFRFVRFDHQVEQVAP